MHRYSAEEVQREIDRDKRIKPAEARLMQRSHHLRALRKRATPARRRARFNGHCYRRRRARCCSVRS
jgi:hypothetical protein